MAFCEFRAPAPAPNQEKALQLYRELMLFATPDVIRTLPPVCLIGAILSRHDYHPYCSQLESTSAACEAFPDLTTSEVIGIHAPDDFNKRVRIYQQTLFSPDYLKIMDIASFPPKALKEEVHFSLQGREEILSNTLFHYDTNIGPVKGYATLVVDNHDKAVYFSRFFPYHESGTDPIEPTTLLHGKGLATYIEFMILNSLPRREFSKREIIHAIEGMSSDRQDQLKRLGIDPRCRYKWNTYLNILKQYLLQKGY